MLSKRQVSNEEYENAYYSKDNKRVIKEVTSKYKSILSEDDQESCGMQGLWDALINHEDGKGNKFTTSLFTYVRWRCLNKVKKLNKIRAGETLFSDYKTNAKSFVDKTVDIQSKKESGAGSREDMNNVYELMERYLSREDRDIVVDYAINGLSMEEIAVKNNCSKCRIGIKYERAKKFIKEVSDGV